jgi:chromosome segregation ATPase
MFNFLKKGETGEKKAEPEKKIEVKQESNEPSFEITKLSSEVDRVKTSMEAFGEIRKSFTERFDRISEEIGELRSMILDRDRTIQEIELKAVKSSSLVESVQPEKLMSEVRKQEAKIEALKANLEGNESIMDRVMEELKDAKKKIEFFRGVEEIIKLSEEVKSELVEIKKVEASTRINSDKVDTIYSEMRKKIQELDIFRGDFQEIKVNIEQNVKDIDFLKNKIGGLAEKEELERLVNKVQRYIQALKELDKKSSLSKDVAQLKTLLESVK